MECDGFIFSYEEGVANDFNLSADAVVPKGMYSYQNVFSMISTPFTKPLVFEFTINGGQFYDGTRGLIHDRTYVKSFFQLSTGRIIQL